MDEDLDVIPDVPARQVSPITSITGPAPVANPQQELMRRQAASNAALWKQLQSRTSNQPIAQTEQAVAAALRFQGQRQYQRDLESGMAPGEALARSAPMIFSQPRQGNIGQAGAFIRATSKPAMRTMDVGGVLYRVNPDGTATAITPPKPPAAPKPSAFDTQEYRSILSEIAANRKALDSMEMVSPEADAARSKIRLLTSQLDTIRKRTPSQTSGTGNTGKRVRVTGPGGKRGTVPQGTRLPEGWSLIP